VPQLTKHRISCNMIVTSFIRTLSPHPGRGTPWELFRAYRDGHVSGPVGKGDADSGTDVTDARPVGKCGCRQDGSYPISQWIANTLWMVKPSISIFPSSPDIMIRVKSVHPVAAAPFSNPPISRL